MLHRCLLALCLLHCSTAQRYGGAAARSPPRLAVVGESNSGNDILAQVSDVSPDGSFYTKWQTANGISYEEQGQLKNPGSQDEAEQVQGSASWTTNEGEKVSITWQADENGAVFHGDHLPTAPPAPEIPPLIQRALDWIAANPSRKGDNEGEYREEQDSGAAAVAAAAARPTPQQRTLLLRRPPPPRRFS